MTKSSNASAVENGFLFQINVAIYLMIKHIAELDKIRVEGLKQDIELELKSQKKIMVQVKSQWKNLDIKTNVLKDLDSSLKSLYNSDGESIRDLMYVSNLPDPFKNDDIEFTTYHGITTKKYSELQENSKEVVDSRLKKLKIDLNKEKLWIMRIPFFGTDDSEKHKFIYDTIKEFINSFGGVGEKISPRDFIYYWEGKFLHNGADDPKICISKSNLANYLILCYLSGYDGSDKYDRLNINEDDYEEAYDKYSNFIMEKQECYEAICKVNCLFERANRNEKLSKEEFVQSKKNELYEYFFCENCNDHTTEYDKIDIIVAQITSYIILKKRNAIKKINEGVLI